VDFENITPDMIKSFLIVAVVLVGLILTIWSLIDKIRNASKPAKELAQWRKDTDARIKNTEDGQKVICRGILALLSHEINGNSTDKLKASQTEITNYLIDRRR